MKQNKDLKIQIFHLEIICLLTDNNIDVYFDAIYKYKVVKSKLGYYRLKNVLTDNESDNLNNYATEINQGKFYVLFKDISLFNSLNKTFICGFDKEMYTKQNILSMSEEKRLETSYKDTEFSTNFGNISDFIEDYQMIRKKVLKRLHCNFVKFSRFIMLQKQTKVYLMREIVQ